MEDFELALPRHDAGLHIEHNPHRVCYETVEQHIQAIGSDGEHYSFASAEDRQRCIDRGELWTMQWYPSTPVGFYAVASSTLEGLLRFAQEVQDQEGIEVHAEEIRHDRIGEGRC